MRQGSMQAACREAEKVGCVLGVGSLFARCLLCASCKADADKHYDTATKTAPACSERKHGRITNLSRCSQAHRLNVRQQALHDWFSGSRRNTSSQLKGQGENQGENLSVVVGKGGFPCVGCGAGLCSWHETPLRRAAQPPCTLQGLVQMLC